jgi:hypothetical protein
VAFEEAGQLGAAWTARREGAAGDELDGAVGADAADAEAALLGDEQTAMSSRPSSGLRRSCTVVAAARPAVSRRRAP